ncbi:MAG: DUF1189 family protein [Anaerolineales bacterium]
METHLDFGQADLPEEGKEGAADKLIWLLKGFVYPIWNRPYYLEAVMRGMGLTLVFLLFFALLQTIVATTTVASSLSRFSTEIERAYVSGEIPDIRIENGIASTSGSGKYLIANNRQLVGVDTTGATPAIDTNQFSEGILLTRTEIHLVNEDGYQVIPLTDLNQTFGNPIVLDSASVTKLWSRIAVFIDLAVFFGGFLFYSVGRFIYLVMLGLVVWAAASLSRNGVDFAPVLITGIFANVPTTYLIFLLRNIGFTFFGLRALLLFGIWGIAMAYVLKVPKGQPGSDLPEDLKP